MLAWVETHNFWIELKWHWITINYHRIKYHKGKIYVAQRLPGGDELKGRVA